MKMEELRRFEPLFKYARHLGADAALRRHLGVPDDYLIPLTVPHGVDFGFSKVGYDVYSVEPIYWATNPHSYDLAIRVKPTVRIPHPFLLAARGVEVPKGEGTLVVGPPPGPTNDRNLAELMKGYDPTTTTILVKPHLNYHKSAAFWGGLGFATVSLADEGPPSYDGMVRLFSRYERFVGCTVSSAIFFAAALGKPITLMRGFVYGAYEAIHIHSVMDFRSARAAAVVRELHDGTVEQTTALARRLLGSEFDMTPSTIRESIEREVAALEWPLFSRTRYPRILRRYFEDVACKFDRPGLFSRSYPEVIKARLRPDVFIVDLDEVSLWLDGANDRNLRFSRTKYIKGLRDPGVATDSYED